jgi:hypothetical protein
MTHYTIQSTGRRKPHPRFGCILARGWWRVDVQDGVHRFPRGPFPSEDAADAAERPSFSRELEATASAAG